MISMMKLKNTDTDECALVITDPHILEDVFMDMIAQKRIYEARKKQVKRAKRAKKQ